MSRQTLLSLETGVPVALVVAALLFWLEANRVTERRNPFVLRASTVVASVVLVFLVIARFVEYT